MNPILSRPVLPECCLQLPARAYPGHEAVQPHAQQCARVVRRRSQRITVYLHAKLRPAIPPQRVNELGHESRWMVQRQQLVKRRRQHPYLLTTHISKRHLLDSLSQSRLTVYTSVPLLTYETGSTANFSLGIPHIGASGPSGLEAPISHRRIAEAQYPRMRLGASQYRIRARFMHRPSPRFPILDVL